MAKRWPQGTDVHKSCSCATQHQHSKSPTQQIVVVKHVTSDRKDCSLEMSDFPFHFNKGENVQYKTIPAMPYLSCIYPRLSINYKLELPASDLYANQPNTQPQALQTRRRTNLRFQSHHLLSDNRAPAATFLACSLYHAPVLLKFELHNSNPTI